jgi:D-alanine-D-alanine ligase-like ATP-grasp enzyme
MPKNVCLVHQTSETWLRDTANHGRPDLIAEAIMRDADVADLSDALSKAGYHVRSFAFSDCNRRDIIKFLRRDDTIFWNVTDGDDIFRGEDIPSLLRFLNFPFVGSTTYTQALCQRKHHWRAILKSHGVAIAAGIHALPHTPNILDRLESLEYPVFVKPANLGNDAGLRRIDPICSTPSEALMAVRCLHEAGMPSVLIEKFLDGAEFTVPGVYAQEWNMLCYQVKYSSKYLTPDMKEYNATARYQENEVQQPDIIDVARNVVSALNISDYFRMDFRSDKNGKIYPIDVNCNPFFLRSECVVDFGEKVFGSTSKMLRSLIENSFNNQNHKIYSIF